MILRILALLQSEQLYILHTEACDYQSQCTFLRQQPNRDKLPVEYRSRLLSAQKKSYPKGEKRFLTAMWIILTLRPYLYGVPFTFCTNHQALKCFLTLAISCGRLGC